MNGVWVSELSRRSGVPATTLRFYEREGLLPAGRTAAGYRVYDETAQDRLRFIATAKRLRLPLPEIRRLLRPWEHGVCRDVQAELDPLLQARIGQTGRHISELHEFRDRLERAQAQLAAIDRDGPCDRSCAFLHEPGTEPASIPALDEVVAGENTQAAIACTLGSADRDIRAQDWAAALTSVAARRAIDRGLRLEFDPERTDVGELASLADAEARCCAFFEITLRFGPVPTLEVRAPAYALVLVTELFGEPDS